MCQSDIDTENYIFAVSFLERFLLIFLNENHIAGENIEKIDQTGLNFTLIMPKIDFPQNFA